MTLVLLLIRVVAGVPLPVEVISDRLIPQLSVHTFVRLLGRVGGPLKGKELAYLTAFGIQLAASAAGGAVYAVVPDRARRPVWWAVALAVLWGAFVIGLWPALESNYRGLGPAAARTAAAIGLLAAFGVYGLAVDYALRRAGPSPNAEGRRISRRSLVLAGAGGLAAVASGGLAGVLYRRATFGAFGYDGLQLRGPTTTPVTPNERFYVVTKNLIDPTVSGSLWRLQVTGLVSRPRSYSMAEIEALPAVEQEQTLECISNRVGSGLISNAAWTGTSLASILQRAGPSPEAIRVLLHAADGYVHAVSVDKAMQPSTLVAYRMNGQPLPGRHGYPARALVPGTYGEVNVKWLDRVELVDSVEEGYYERQGWKPSFVNTTSRYDHPQAGQRLAIGGVQLRGIAFAGDRGISRVDVSTDGGATWTAARIGYPGTRLTWSLWSLDWRPSRPGRYRLVVRATDGNGNVQTSKEHGAVPSGATGYHEVAVEVAG